MVAKKTPKPADGEKTNPFKAFVEALGPKTVDVPLDDGEVWEVDPPDIATFITSPDYLDLPPLSSRQLRALTEGLERTGKELFAHENKYNELLLLWGKGCLAEEERLTDVRTGQTHTVAEWASLGCSLTVQTLTDNYKIRTEVATPVVQVGEVHLFRVTLASGKSFRCSADHMVKVLDLQQLPAKWPCSWKEIKDVKVGDYVMARGKLEHLPFEFVRIDAIEPDGFGPVYDLTVPGTWCYFDSQGILHHNSGKDYLSSIVISYIAYVVCCMKHPHRTLGLAPGENIDVVNVATRAEQAKDVFFTKLEARIRRPCFEQFKPHFTQNKILFLERNLRLHSLHSKEQKWEGYNLLAWVMDEADAFSTADGHANATKIHTVLRSSAISRFPDVRWIGLIISYPRSEVGFMLTYGQYCKDADTAYVDRAATWEVHPHYDPGHPQFKNFDWVTVHDTYTVPKPYESDFILDPKNAAMTYMCIPPPLEGAFFEHPDLLEVCATKELQPAVFVRHRTTLREVPDVVDINGKPEIRRYASVELVRRIKEPGPYRYFIHGDPGEVKDAFALALVHTLPEAETIQTMETAVTLNRVEVDLLLQWEPGHNKTVDMINVRDVIHQLCRVYPVVQVSFDKFQSAQIIQELLELGINARQMSFSRSQQLEMYRALKIMVYQRLIRWPEAHWEMLRPQLRYLIQKGTKIDHDEKLSAKDLADALAAAAWYASGASLGRVGREVLETVFSGDATSQVGKITRRLTA